jgi:ketosteroid isomerase-like protein
MMKMLRIVGCAALSVPLAASSMPQTESVLDAERAGCLAYEHNSVEGLRSFLEDDYTLTDSKGIVTTKQDDLDDFLKGRIHYTAFFNKGMKVRLYGDAAVVIGQTVVRGTSQGQPFDVEVQFTDTLVRRGGRWRLAAGHVSRLHNGLRAPAGMSSPAWSGIGVRL